jgi:hypothetical protein
MDRCYWFDPIRNKETVYMGNRYYVSDGLLSRMSRLEREESAHVMLKA